jgi:hypothetical protein
MSFAFFAVKLFLNAKDAMIEDAKRRKEKPSIQSASPLDSHKAFEGACGTL